MLIEFNIDGIVGPTHHFGGLGVGNVASQEHHQQVSKPRQAAIEGLRKAQLIDSMGIPQFVFPPPPRPRLSFLRQLGVVINQHELSQQALVQAKTEMPRGLSAAFSSAFMWMANAATVTPACDSIDNRLHCTPANLISSWHRASESSERSLQLRSFVSPLGDAFSLHDALPSIVPLRDEGAANHMRLCDRSAQSGINLFVYGIGESSSGSPAKHFPRHTREASEAIARLHQLSKENTFFLQQHPQAIDAGVFHNDVIATSCGNLLLHHELAFWNEQATLENIEKRFRDYTHESLVRLQISNDELPLKDAVQSYFFNSQILRLPNSYKTDPRYAIVCPHHCQRVSSAKKLVDWLIADTKIPIDESHFVHLEESMANGGGPACLRLRMMMPASDVVKLNSRFRLDARLAERLQKVFELYPSELRPTDDFSVDFIEHLQEIDRNFRMIFTR